MNTKRLSIIAVIGVAAGIGAVQAVSALESDEPKQAVVGQPGKYLETLSVGVREQGDDLCLDIGIPADGDRQSGSSWACFKRSQLDDKTVSWSAFQSDQGAVIAGFVPPGATRIEARSSSVQNARIVPLKPELGGANLRAFVVEQPGKSERSTLVALNASGDEVASVDGPKVVDQKAPSDE